jgi:hypothetical protein
MGHAATLEHVEQPVALAVGRILVPLGQEPRRVDEADDVVVGVDQGPEEPLALVLVRVGRVLVDGNLDEFVDVAASAKSSSRSGLWFLASGFQFPDMLLEDVAAPLRGQMKPNPCP